MQTAKIGAVKCLVLQLIDIVESLSHSNNNKTCPLVVEYIRLHLYNYCGIYINYYGIVLFEQMLKINISVESNSFCDRWMVDIFPAGKQIFRKSASYRR